jgi:hypothetical protein
VLALQHERVVEEVQAPNWKQSSPRRRALAARPRSSSHRRQTAMPTRNEQKRRALAARSHFSSCPVKPTRNEQIRAAAAEIRRHATAIAIKRRPLTPRRCPTAPMIKNWIEYLQEDRPLFVYPENARLRRVLMSCVCRRRAG